MKSTFLGLDPCCDSLKFTIPQNWASLWSLHLPTFQFLTEIFTFHSVLIHLLILQASALTFMKDKLSLNFSQLFATFLESLSCACTLSFSLCSSLTIPSPTLCILWAFPLFHFEFFLFHFDFSLFYFPSCVMVGPGGCLKTWLQQEREKCVGEREIPPGLKMLWGNRRSEHPRFLSAAEKNQILCSEKLWRSLVQG